MCTSMYSGGGVLKSQHKDGSGEEVPEAKEQQCKVSTKTKVGSQVWKHFEFTEKDNVDQKHVLTISLNQIKLKR